MAITRPLLRDLPDEWKSERLVLRRWRDEDAQALYDAIIESREHIRPWMPWADTYQTVDDAIEFIRRQSGQSALDDEVVIGIFARDDHTPLGGSGFHVHNLAIPSFEIGYWLRQSAEGHGYMSEAVRTITRFLFDDMGAQRVMIRCDARNVRSKAVAERLGFPFEGTMRHDTLDPTGTIRDSLVYAMIPDDYARVRGTWA
ncbi:MAG: GNAT family N-acetyltransferase [Chloroflexota bacterium]|nr:GNAT family N-acetyltransferase [Chloroflexota bacterium]